MEKYIVFNYVLANKLLKANFNIIEISKNLKYKDKLVFVFEKSIELLEEIEKNKNI